MNSPFQILNIIFILIIITINLSCSTFIPNPTRVNKKNSTYVYKINKEVWREVDPDTSDMAFSNAQTGSHIFLNSICKKYAPSSIESQNSSLLASINDIKIIKKEKITIENREAIKLIGNGRVDGVLINFHILSFQRNRCFFDLALIGGIRPLTKEEVEDYNYFIRTLHFID